MSKKERRRPYGKQKEIADSEAKTKVVTDSTYRKLKNSFIKYKGVHMYEKSNYFIIVNNDARGSRL